MKHVEPGQRISISLSPKKKNHSQLFLMDMHLTCGDWRAGVYPVGNSSSPGCCRWRNAGGSCCVLGRMDYAPPRRKSPAQPLPQDGFFWFIMGIQAHRNILTICGVKALNISSQTSAFLSSFFFFFNISTSPHGHVDGKVITLSHTKKPEKSVKEERERER